MVSRSSLDLTLPVLSFRCVVALANTCQAALEVAMEKRSFELLKAAIPEAEAYGIDTSAAKVWFVGTCSVVGHGRATAL